MFILDDIYVSNEVLEFLETSHEPVLDDEAARRFANTYRLNLCSQVEAAELAKNPDFRICTLSEVHLETAKQISDANTARAIDLCKDKAAFRRALAPLFPRYVFEEHTFEALQAIDPASVSYPVVIKPSTGFFSLGIYPAFNANDWQAALADISANSSTWNNIYSSSVVNDSRFLVESYIEGTEYAIDVYFTAEGEPVILNILEHVFAGSKDVSDRLYFTSKEVIETRMGPMMAFMESANQLLGFKNFALHAEVRVLDNGTVIPIEFNPLRFAGLCTTDTSYFAYGIKTYEYFLMGKRPDWEAILEGKDGLTYTMILLGKDGFDPSTPYTFDYDALIARFRKVLMIRPVKYEDLGIFGFLFTETQEQDRPQEITWTLNSTLEEFITQ